MKYLYLVWGLVIFIQGCDIFKKNSNYNPLIPEETPFIVGILEATNDTVHHYPEVYVGYLSQPKGFETNLVWKIPGIWWPVTNVQVTRPATRMGLKREHDTEAKVTIKGPLGESNETKVRFAHTGKGVYGDVQYQLPLIGGESYRLSVTMGDDRLYTATTQIPELFEWNVPDTVILELELKQYVSGRYYEQEKKDALLTFSVSPETEYITYQNNSEYDYHNFNTSPGNFLFDNRGNYLRFGAAYGIFDVSDQPQLRAIQIGWFESNDGTPLRTSMSWWLTMNQLNERLSRFYYSVFPRLATSDNGRYDRQDLARIKVQREHDSSYLFKYMSNIVKGGKNDEVLPKEQSNAFGVFGAYTASYQNLTVIPKRSWDPDTLNWGN